MSERDQTNSGLTPALIGGVVGGVVGGAVAGYIVASSIEMGPGTIPFPEGATPDYICIAGLATGGDAASDYIGSIPPGRSCPHQNPCNNIGSLSEMQKCKEKQSQ
jgi:hypothetical protein